MHIAKTHFLLGKMWNLWSPRKCQIRLLFLQGGNVSVKLSLQYMTWDTSACLSYYNYKIHVMRQFLIPLIYLWNDSRHRRCLVKILFSRTHAIKDHIMKYFMVNYHNWLVHCCVNVLSTLLGPYWPVLIPATVPCQTFLISKVITSFCGNLSRYH